MTLHSPARKKHQTTNLGVRSSNLFGCAILSKGLSRMADDQEMSGGTLGASEWLTTHHTYSESELSKIREFWTPSDQWRGEIESLLSLDKLDALDESRSEFEKIKADRLSGKSNFEELATTFLRRSSSAVGKASGTMQKAYIQRVQELATDLSALLQEPSIRGTPADLFALARRNMDPNFVFKVEMELLTDLAMISMLANIRLRNRTLPDEEVVHAIVDKTTYDRFRFASGAINFYERSTGRPQPVGSTDRNRVRR